MLYEIAHAFEHIKKDKKHMRQGIEKNTPTARTLGTNHPILRAATKVYALLADQENTQLISKCELKI